MHSEIFPLQNYSPRKNASGWSREQQEGLLAKLNMKVLCGASRYLQVRFLSCGRRGIREGVKHENILEQFFVYGNRVRNAEFSKTAVVAQRALDIRIITPCRNPRSVYFVFDFSIHLRPLTLGFSQDFLNRIFQGC